MINKKDILIKILEKLEWDWNIAPWILALVKSSYSDDNMIDGLIKIIEIAIQWSNSKIQQQSLKRSLEIIKKIKEQEDQEMYSEQELDNILSEI